MKLLHTPSTQKGRTSLPPPFLPRFPVHRAFAPQVPTPSTTRLRGRAHKFKGGTPKSSFFLLPPLLTAAQMPRPALTGCLEPLFRPHVSTGCCWHPSCERHIRRVEQTYTPLLAWGPHQLWTQLRNCCWGDTGTEIHHATREHTRRSYPEGERKSEPTSFHVLCLPHPLPARAATFANTLGRARLAGSPSASWPILPLTKSLPSSFLQGRTPSLTHSEDQPPSHDEPEPPSKQLLSDSVRLKQAPGGTEFSHLPKEINKRVVRPCEDVPPASSTVGTFRRHPRHDVLGSDTRTCLNPVLQGAAQKTLPPVTAPVRGRVAPRPLPSLRCAPSTKQVLNLSAPVSTPVKWEHLPHNTVDRAKQHVGAS